MSAAAVQSPLAPASAAAPAAGQPPVWLLVHVPKCAGLTIEEHLRKHLPPAARLDPARRKSPGRYFSRPFYTLPAEQDFAQVRAVIGHFFGRSIRRLFAGRETRECIMLRDPLGYLLSHYNYRMNRYARRGKNMFDFKLWYKTRPLNPISHFILTRYLEVPVTALWRMSSRERLQRIEEAFADFAYVATFKSCNDFLTRVSCELGIPQTFEVVNVNSNKLVTQDSLPAALQQRIIEENAVDSALFEKYRYRGWAPDQLGPSPQALRDSRWQALCRDLQRPAYVVCARLLRDVMPRRRK